MIWRTLDESLSAAFAAAGYADVVATVEPSRRPDVGQFQCTTALSMAKRFRQSPLAIARAVVEKLPEYPFARVSVDGPGFINFSLADEFLARETGAVLADPRQGSPPVESRRLLLDFGGPNVAKRMHVGHLRSTIIGDCLQRLSRFLGHDVVSDVHLGDWGLPMGMLISEIRRRWPDLAYFAPSAATGEFPPDDIITVDLLSQLYPEAAQRTAADPDALRRAKEETTALQGGDPGLRALWRRMVDVSVEAVRADFSLLGVTLDLWEGESDVHDRLNALIEHFVATGAADRSEGALVIPLERTGDVEPVPPLMLVKSDGSVTYGATDLATIAHRVEHHDPDGMLYVVDQRQRLHFVQVFRAAEVTGLVQPEHPVLEHIGFGTVNGPDGKPLKTRAGETMTLRALLELTIGEARSRVGEIGLGSDIDEAEREVIAQRIALATIKFADLRNQRQSDYIFDLAQFSSFEGKTGPYVCYTAVRARSILTKAAAKELADGPLLPPGTEDERRIALVLLDFGRALLETFERRAPNVLCEHVFELAQRFNAFYHTCHILSEPDAALRGSRLTMTRGVLDQLTLALSMLGIEVPDRM
jgi:arginyl-tRNA synthetase